MDLLGVIRACLRRWYVFFPLMGLTVWLCLQQYRAAVPEYTSTASVVVVPSTELIIARGQQGQGQTVVTTPFISGSAQGTLAGLLTSALNTNTVRGQLLPGGGVALLAERDPEVDDTLVTVTLVGNDAATVGEAVAAVQGNANGILSGLQTSVGAPATQLFAAVPGGPVDPPLEDFPDRLRAVVALGLAGTLLAVVLSVLAQSLMRGRRKRKDRTAAQIGAEAAPVAPRSGHPQAHAGRLTGGRLAAKPRAPLGRRRGASRREPIDVTDDSLVRHW